MGGIHVNADTQMSTVPGLFAAGECASGINGANRLGGNSLSDLLVLENAPANSRRSSPRKTARRDRPNADRRRARQALEPFQRGDAGENPYRVQRDLQEMMQDLVGIVRREDEMQRALDGLQKLGQRAAGAASTATSNTIPAGTPRSI
jgi:succinate dehydrogenase / fumarate reductase flavoprotein subunit